MPEHAKKKGSLHEKTFEPADVIEAEREHLDLKDKKVSGLAISGGGIRSASFGLGVMQALVSNDKLSKMDYMSTVSGGGYLGSALTWALHQGGKNSGTTPDTFPLGKRGTHRDKDTVLQNDPLDEDDNKLLDFIRQHGSYLAPTSSLNMVSFVAVVMRSMVMSLFVYFSFLTVAITLAVWLLYYLTNKLLYAVGNNSDQTKGVMIIIGLAILIFIIFKGFLYSLSTFFSGKNKILKIC